MKNVLPEVLVGFVAMLSGLALGTGCAYLRESAAQPCPPHELASIDTRYAVEAITACKAEGATADTCKALPAIRAKYARERQAWVECGGGK
jgi:hypothetical protein